MSCPRKARAVQASQLACHRHRTFSQSTFLRHHLLHSRLRSSTASISRRYSQRDFLPSVRVSWQQTLASLRLLGPGTLRRPELRPWTGWLRFQFEVAERCGPQRGSWSGRGRLASSAAACADKVLPCSSCRSMSGLPARRGSLRKEGAAVAEYGADWLHRLPSAVERAGTLKEQACGIWEQGLHT